MSQLGLGGSEIWDEGLFIIHFESDSFLNVKSEHLLDDKLISHNHNIVFPSYSKSRRVKELLVLTLHAVLKLMSSYWTYPGLIYHSYSTQYCEGCSHRPGQWPFVRLPCVLARFPIQTPSENAFQETQKRKELLSPEKRSKDFNEALIQAWQERW